MTTVTQVVRPTFLPGVTLMASDGDAQSVDGTEQSRDDHGEERQEFPDTLDVSDNARHYYVKCLACEKLIHDSEDAHDADCAARRHAGTHSGLFGEEAEIVITNHNGRELRRFHAIYKDEQYQDSALWDCPRCSERYKWSDGASCPNCGYIREGNRLGSENQEGST